MVNSLVTAILRAFGQGIGNWFLSLFGLAKKDGSPLGEAGIGVDNVQPPTSRGDGSRRPVGAAGEQDNEQDGVPHILTNLSRSPRVDLPDLTG